jgi:hypothetical protein
MLKRVLALSTALALAASAAAAQPGNAADPIVIKMKRGSDSVRLTGVLRQNAACCTYAFKASAGQTLYWRITGSATRQTIGYPDGHVDGPGLPNPVPLPASGLYSFSVSPNLMADGAFGRYVLKIRIPPLRDPPP